MTKHTERVGIVGVGLYLPPEIRTNDWWPASTVAAWRANRPSPPRLPDNLTPGAKLVVEALAKQEQDPFQGAVERHVMPRGMTLLDMEEAAARQAIARAGLEVGDIDLVLTHSVLPDYLLSNPATTLHERLGLPRQCFAMPCEAAAYSFMMQLTIAESMIISGRAKHALLVQSCAATGLIDNDDPHAPLFGDGATAVVLAPVSPGSGIQASVHFADGRFPKTLIASVRGGSMFDEGRAVIHVEDHAQMGAVFLRTADVCKESIDAVLAQANVRASDIDYFGMYQGTPWLRRVVEEFTGLTGARSVESFARTGYLFSAIVPAGLALAEQEGLLRDGDLVLLTGGGTGMTYGSTILRWGR